MDCQEFMRKNDSSSSSQNEDQSVLGDDQPTTRIVVQQQSSRNNQDHYKGRVVMEDAKSQNFNYQIHSESGKSSWPSSQCRPSIYDASQRNQINYCERKKNMRNDGYSKDINMKFPYFNPQKYDIQYQGNQHQQYHHNGNRNKYFDNQHNYNRNQNHHYRNQNYRNRNQNYQNRNNFGNQKRHNQYDNRRWNNNHYQQRQNGYYDNDYNENQICYQRENHRYQYNHRHQRQQYNHRPQRQYQRQSQYNRKQNYQRQKYQNFNDQYQYEQQKRYQKNDKQRNLSNRQQINPVKKPNQRTTQLKSDLQERKPLNKHDNTKGQKKSNTEKPLIKENNPKQIQPKQEKNQQQKSKRLQQNNQNQRSLKQSKSQQKPNIQAKNLQQKPQKQAKKLQQQKPQRQSENQTKITKQIQNDQVELSQTQEQNGLNKAQKNIQLNQSQKQRQEINQKQNQKQEQSDWDASQDNQQNQNQDQNLDKQSFECHQISLQLPLPPPIVNNSHNLSNYEEDFSILEELKIQNKVNPNQKMCQKMKEKPIQKKKTQNNSYNSNFQDQIFSFSQKQLKTMTKMFNILPQDQRSIFIELKIKTSNVSTYKLKTISSQIFNLKSTLTEQIKDHPFIKIISSEKNVPRDIIPQSYEQKNDSKNKNKNDDSKNSKLVLAQIKYPLNFLQHKAKYVQKDQRQILKKIEKNKKLFEDVYQLINIDQITLRCSSCYKKKTFLWNNNIIPNLCRADCPNFLRFDIESMYMC